MKKLLAITVLTAILWTLWAPIALAKHENGKDHKDLRIYYSESLGIPEEVKVYQYQACAMVPKVAPLRCNEDTKQISSKQCVDTETNKLNSGTIIKGCVKGEKPPPIPGTLYKKLTVSHVEAYDTAGEGENACPASKQEFVYAPVYGIATDTGEIIKEVVWTNAGLTFDSGLPDTEIQKHVPEGSNRLYLASRIHTPAFCIKWDEVIQGDEESDKFIDALKSVPATERLRLGKTVTHVNALKAAGCNNDNRSVKLGGEVNTERSTIFIDEPIVSCTARYRIKGDSGVDIFTTYVGFIYRWAASIVGIISVLVITASGIQISMAGGDTARIDSAKTRIMQSIVGLAILFLASLIMYTINPGFFVA